MTLICRYLRAVIFGLIVTLVVCVTVSVFYRYVLQNSLFWATEVSNFLFVWIVFLGAVVAFHEKKHIAFTAIVDALPARPRAFVELLTYLIVFGFAVFLLITGLIVVRDTMASLSEALKVPMGYLYVCAPLAALLIAVDTIESMRDRLRLLTAAGSGS
jgi:TRAP-type C4-dicarboxylate transport system permease small subunit